MSVVREDIDEVLRLVRPTALDEEELILREFADIKETLLEVKKGLE
jgi:hypothetical protein